jgi:hypothetical protein
MAILDMIPGQRRSFELLLFIAIPFGYSSLLPSRNFCFKTILDAHILIRTILDTHTMTQKETEIKGSDPLFPVRWGKPRWRGP